MYNKNKLEKKAILTTIIGNAFMAVLGVSFAFYTNSNAIFIDGIYSLSDFIVGILALKVASLLAYNDNTENPFGYSIYEPILNLSKGLLIALIVVIAFFDSLTCIIDGGRIIKADVALFYSLISTIGCFIVFFIVKKLAKETGSPILKIDTKQWFIDGLISASIGISFIIIWILKENDMHEISRYADPIVVMVLVMIMLPMPIEIIRDNWKQILGKKVSNTLYESIEDIVSISLKEVGYESFKLRVVELGRMRYIQVYIVMKTDSKISLQKQDDLREIFYNKLSKNLENFSLDLIFTYNPIWISHSIKNSY